MNTKWTFGELVHIVHFPSISVYSNWVELTNINSEIFDDFYLEFMVSRKTGGGSKWMRLVSRFHFLFCFIELFAYEFILKLQDYLKLKDLTVEESKMLMFWRLRMAKFGANYGEPKKLCPLCKKHFDSQESFFNTCEQLSIFKITFQYQEIFRRPTSEIAKVLKHINHVRENQWNWNGKHKKPPPGAH